jgi:PAS domain S-box-containing protein
MQLHLKTSRTAVPGKVLNMYQSDLGSRYRQLVKSAALMEKEKRQYRYAFEQVDDIFNNAPCGYYCIDDQGHFVRINDTALQWIGYGRRELVGKKKIRDLLAPDSQRLFDDLFPLFKKTGHAHNIEFEIICKNGARLPLQLNATAVYNQRGKFEMSRCIIVDITERKRNERVLREQNEKLYMLNQEKDRFIAIAAHDLQHPLAAITMLSRYLMDEFAGHSQAVGDICTMIQQSATEMKGLIKNYLDVRKLESGALHINRIECNISQLAADIVSRYQDIAGKKDILLTFSAEGKQWSVTDPQCLEQIIENLISNAIKFTRPGNKIFVRVAERNKQVIVEVKDQGQGIPKKEIPLLFEKFQRLSVRPTNGELSTGLGLSIVKFLADKLDASIEVKSKVGAGSVFNVAL